MIAHRASLLALFIGLMIWLWYPYFSKKEITQTNNQNELAKRPDYIATDLQQTNYAEDGLKSYTVIAKVMKLYQELKYSWFEKPEFILYNGVQNWHISADEANLYDDNILILEGDVVANNLTKNAMITHIKASSIRIDINTKTMASDLNVELLGPSLNITGKGLTADLNSEVIKIINNTRTVYHDK